MMLLSENLKGPIWNWVRRKFRLNIYIDFHYYTVGLSRTTATSQVELFVIVTSDFKLLATVMKNSILGVSWVLNPSLCMELTNENCTFSYKLHRFILEKINSSIQGVSWTWIRRSEDVFGKSFSRLTNFQVTPCIHGTLRPVSSLNYYFYVIHYHK